MAARTALILDPMLATGGTLVATVDMLKAAGATRTKGLFLVAAPEGLTALEASHPDVEVYTASIGERLNEKGHILPGLGDSSNTHPDHRINPTPPYTAAETLTPPPWHRIV